VKKIQFFPTWSENELHVDIMRRHDDGSCADDVCLEFNDQDVVELRNLNRNDESIVHVFLPQYYGLDVVLENGSIVTHDKIEAKSGFVCLHTNCGSLSVNKVRTERIELSARALNINAVAEGSVHAECETIVAKQILGPYCKVLCTNDIDIASLYVSTSEISSISGRVNIGTNQGSSKIRNAGDVRIDSAVGELDIVSDEGHVSVHLDKCIRGAEHSLSSSTGKVNITAATPCTTRADFSIFPDCDGEIICDTNGSFETETRTEFHAQDGVSESLVGVIRDSGASSLSLTTSGKISEEGRNMAAILSAGASDNDSDEMCIIKATASRGIEFTAKSWRQMMEERMMRGSMMRGSFEGSD